MSASFPHDRRDSDFGTPWVTGGYRFYHPVAVVPSGVPMEPVAFKSHLPPIRSCPNDECPYVIERIEGGWRYFVKAEAAETTCPHCGRILEARA